MSSARTLLVDGVLRALKWNTIGIATRALVQLVVMVTIARWVGPEAFGQFGLCMLVFGVGILIADAGLGVALVQCVTLDRSLQRRAFGRLLLSHTLCAAAIALAAPWLNHRLGFAGDASLIQLTALAVLVTAVHPLATALRRRALDFGTLQRAQLVAYTVGYGVVGLSLAALQYGALSLVLALLVHQSVMALWVCHGSGQPWRPSPPFGLASLQRFGLQATLSNLANWVTEYLPGVWLASSHGASGLGLYNAAHNLARTPANHIVTALQQLVVSASSRAQHDVEALRRGYLALLRCVTMIVGPLFLSAAAVAPTVVNALYGSAWSDAASVFTPLAIAMPLHAVMAVTGSMLWGRGRADLEWSAQGVVAVVTTVVLLLAAQLSLPQFAWALCALYALRASLVATALARELRLSTPVLWDTLRVPMACSALAASITWLLDSWLRTRDAPATSALVVIVLVGAGLVALTMRLAGARLLGREMSPVLQRLPLRYQRWLGMGR